MVKFKMPSKEKDEQPLITLKAFFEEEPVTKMYHRYRTEIHEIKLTDTRIATFLRSINKSDKHGASRFSKEEQFQKMCEFIITRAKPFKHSRKFSGAEWEASMRSLMKRVFKEDWDRDDFDNQLLEVDATSQKVQA